MAPVSYSYEFSSSKTTSTPAGTASRTVHTTPAGTTVTERTQPTDGEQNTSTNYFPSGNRQGGSNDISITAEEAERRYLEAMEDEYAKREGGA
ncbi:hypothetical protein DRE_01157 [Drechslerella stenobrocha 248]|uniref:Uncharacterized protein n=1 Tax=Drechslerella stenobrocha 248 TaxID=1043628 RepID=W7HK13_9PEZI|nr:hypothetical protein DRE_01157 [Drechslerella stenobrocha 248]